MHNRSSKTAPYKIVNDLQHSDKDEQYVLKLKGNLLFVNKSVFLQSTYLPAPETTYTQMHDMLPQHS